jgi:hypothetical protein
MALFYEGYTKAIEAVRKMNRTQLLDHIDGLFGRDNLPDDFTDNDLVEEALTQTKEEFTNKSSPEYEQITFWINVINSSRRLI